VLGNIVKKLLTAIPVLLVVSIVLFVLLNALPGDAADALAAADASPEEIAALREELGLNDPAVVRYFKWISGVVKGDFGKSLISGKPVTDAIVQRFPVTLELTLLAMIVAILILPRTATALWIISAPFLP
jgi:ABC-type dipeptide/oligopeptide/nickel transport system permease component